MADNDKATGREKALVGILERLAGEMQDQDDMLEELIDRQEKFAKSFERAEAHRKSKQIDADRDHDKLLDSFHHYRSDMLKLVNEQDRINKNIDDLENLIKTTIYSMETTTQKLDMLDKKVTQHEKALKEHREYLVKQGEELRSEIAESNQRFAVLHAGTEKNLSNLHHETEGHLKKFRQETTQRLLVLDNIVSSLQTLLTRTDPELKKQPVIVRFFRKISHFFRVTAPLKIVHIFRVAMPTKFSKPRKRK